MSPRRHPSIPSLLAILCLVAAASGCFTAAPRRNLDDRAFVAAAPASTTQTDAPQLAGPPAPDIPVIHLDDRDLIADAGAIAGPPEIDPAIPLDDASPVLVDELVGEINGQPIFANAFLAGLGTLRAIETTFQRDNGGRLPSDADWRREAERIILAELNRLITDELISAESYRTLDVPEQNLRRFLEALRQNEVSLRGGSAAAADRTIQEETGLSTDELIEARGDEVVLMQHLRSFNAGISVSPRDIERYYLTHPKEFNPDPTIAFRMIWVSVDDTAAVERVSQALLDAAPGDKTKVFAELGAEGINRFMPSTGGLFETAFTGELKDQAFLNPDELNQLLVNLQPGEVAGPIEHGGSMKWVSLERVTRIGISLYDAQAMIEAKLRRQEFNRRIDLELMRLQERAGIEQAQLLSITRRLLDIAFDRYRKP